MAFNVTAGICHVFAMSNKIVILNNNNTVTVCMYIYNSLA